MVAGGMVEEVREVEVRAVAAKVAAQAEQEAIWASQGEGALWEEREVVTEVMVVRAVATAVAAPVGG